LNVAVAPIEGFEAGLIRTVDYLQNQGVEVVLSIDIPELEFMLENCLSKRISCEFNRADVL